MIAEEGYPRLADRGQGLVRLYDAQTRQAESRSSSVTSADVHLLVTCFHSKGHFRLGILMASPMSHCRNEL